MVLVCILHKRQHTFCAPVCPYPLQPVCFDELKEGKEPISWCASCGNNIHASCCSEWVRTKTKSHAAVTCIYCRAPWVDGSKPGAAAAAAAGAGSPGGYVNLKQYSEAHR